MTSALDDDVQKPVIVHQENDTGGDDPNPTPKMPPLNTTAMDGDSGDTGGDDPNPTPTDPPE